VGEQNNNQAKISRYKWQPGRVDIYCDGMRFEYHTPNEIWQISCNIWRGEEKNPYGIIYRNYTNALASWDYDGDKEEGEQVSIYPLFPLRKLKLPKYIENICQQLGQTVWAKMEQI